DPELAQLFEAADGLIKRAFGRERPHVQLVDDEQLARKAGPVPLRPVEPIERDDGRGAMHALGLPARGGIRTHRPAVEPKSITLPFLDRAPRPEEIAVGLALHCDGAGPFPHAAIEENDLDRLGARRPDAKRSRAVAVNQGAAGRHPEITVAL